MGSLYSFLSSSIQGEVREWEGAGKGRECAPWSFLEVRATRNSARVLLVPPSWDLSTSMMFTVHRRNLAMKVFKRAPHQALLSDD